MERDAAQADLHLTPQGAKEEFIEEGARNINSADPFGENSKWLPLRNVDASYMCQAAPELCRFLMLWE